MTQNSKLDDQSRTTEFMRLFTSYQRHVYSYIRALVPNLVEAEEVLQQTNLLLWEKFDQFEPGSNFRAWACKVAYLTVLKHRDRRGRGELLFSDAFIDDVASNPTESNEYLDARTRAVEHCRHKLGPADRDLIDRRYRQGIKSGQIADELERPARSVYKSLWRIRRALLDCVARQLAKEGLA